MARPTLSNGLPPKLIHGTTYFCLALGGVFWFTYSGPYRWLAELQMAWFDAYYAMYTWIGASLLLLVPAFAALQAARVAGLLGTVEGSRELARQQSLEFAAQLQHYRWPFIVLVAGGTIAFLAGRDYLRGRDGHTLESLPIAALEGGTRPTSTWVEITGGTAMWDSATAWIDDKTEHVYVPVLSEGWQAGKPVGALLELRPSEQADAQAKRVYRGATYEMGLPGPVRAAYAEAGFPVEQALVVNLNVEPAGNEETDLLGFLAGLGVVLLGLGLGAWKYRTARPSGGA